MHCEINCEKPLTQYNVYQGCALASERARIIAWRSAAVWGADRGCVRAGVPLRHEEPRRGVRGAGRARGGHPRGRVLKVELGFSIRQLR
eukprot:2526415-Rhodomonas_salina.2